MKAKSYKITLHRGEAHSSYDVTQPDIYAAAKGAEIMMYAKHCEKVEIICTDPNAPKTKITIEL
jgi:hypothetical protein